jgi:hypothetical protein
MIKRANLLENCDVCACCRAINVAYNEISIEGTKEVYPWQMKSSLGARFVEDRALS